MKELIIPVAISGDSMKIEAVVYVGDEKTEYNFRIESFDCASNDDIKNCSDKKANRQLSRINNLKNRIESYDKNWELIQIFNPPENARFIQVLYRKKKKFVQ
jgi:hypothetical protein